MRSRCGRRAFRASPIRCVGERIMAKGVPEFREVAWRACRYFFFSIVACVCRYCYGHIGIKKRRNLQRRNHSFSACPKTGL
ncbi:hypothetical protein [Bathymodiolus japonicus methanotrophic gill symbiont]|uniref:hypothetical protein n=1 Tax=Bathymodiolus japonicus methanotrophic gill symbiont TaxID=113269 RepID=UPI001C8D1160|nr:hypothetical protein [Bathymodiolus japonicus methanotrophic gill symbiont]